MNRWIRYYIPSYLWAILIFTISSISISLPAGTEDWSDKLFHLAEFTIFGFLLARSFKNAITPSFRRYFVMLAIIVCGLYGLLDEFHQIFVPQRGFEMLDLLTDFIGGILGAGIYAFIHV